MQKAKELHPDAGGDEEKFKAVSKALSYPCALCCQGALLSLCRVLSLWSCVFSAPNPTTPNHHTHTHRHIQCSLILSDALGTTSSALRTPLNRSLTL